jgi:hypothetical protein
MGVALDFEGKDINYTRKALRSPQLAKISPTDPQYVLIVHFGEFPLFSRYT